MFNSMFHTHKWEILSTDYTPPVTRFKGVESMSEEFAHELFNGTTHVYMQCISCGELKQQDMTGKFNK